MPGRNDPCPCGSGKKYKKCCLGKDQGVTRPPADVVPPAPPKRRSLPAPRPQAPPRPAPPPRAVSLPKPPPPPPDPEAERWQARWKEFVSADPERRVTIFRETLDDPKMIDETAIEMLSRMRQDAAEMGDRPLFATYVAELRQRRPELYEEGAARYAWWLLQDALADGRQEEVARLARELGPRAGTDIDTVNRALDALAYHGQLAVLVEMMRAGWPGAEHSSDIIPWGISEFANKGADYEIYDWLEHTTSPDPGDPTLLERVKFFVEDLREDYLRDFVTDLTGRSGRTWTVEDFVLKPPQKRSSSWDEDEEEEEEPDHGAENLVRLLNEFAGYLRRQEGVPFPRADLARKELYRYFLERHAGDIDPRPSMLERALHPERKLPKPPPPLHPLAPERVTLNVFLGGLVGFLNPQYYKIAAVFETVPAWLRFLQWRGLIGAELRGKVLDDVRPLVPDLVKLWESYPDDPTLLRGIQEWPAEAAKEVPAAPAGG